MNNHPPLPEEEQNKLNEAIKQAKSHLMDMLSNTKKEEQTQILEHLDYLEKHPNG